MPTTFQCYKFGTSLGVQWLRLCPSNAGGSVLSLVWELRVFPGGSDGKESARNVEDLGLIPGLRRSPGEGIGHPLQYSSASLVAQMVKNLPAIWETWVQSLGQEYRLEKGMPTHSSILAWRIPMDRGAWWVTVHGVAQTKPLSNSKQQSD